MAREENTGTTTSAHDLELDEHYLKPPSRSGAWIFLGVVILAAAVAIGLLLSGVA